MIGHLAEQYGTTDRLEARILAHQRYSERADDYKQWMLDRLAATVGDLVLDVGCGFGSYHPDLIARGVRAVLGVDSSKTMVEKAQQQAREQRLPVVVIHADAQALPLPDDSYDSAMANHVFFYIQDQRAALRELRRVVRPGGRVMLTTNVPDHAARLKQLHDSAARQLGYTPSQRVTERFHLGHLSLVREVFPTVETFVREDAFVFPDTDSAVQYYATGLVDAVQDRPADNSHRGPLQALMAEQVKAIIHAEGVFRDPKNSGCFVGFVPPD